MMKLAAYGALVIAGCLLSLQILAAWEYTQGASLYTTASMIAAMVTLAALPVFIEAARRAGFYGTALALGIAFCAFLVYSLPATTGRTGEVKEAKAVAGLDVARIRDDLERTTKTAEWARDDWIKECGTGEGIKCRSKRNTAQALEDRVAKLKADLKAAEPTATGDMGSDLWAWALAPVGATSAVVRKVSVLSFAIGLDMAIWSLIAFAVGVFGRETVSAEPTVSDSFQTSYPPLDTDSATVLAALKSAGKALTNDELADAMSVEKSEASKRAQNAARAGVINRVRSGKFVLHSIAL